MKKVIVISDSFKGTISSNEICGIAAETIPRYFPGCEVVTIPAADGGEGTVEYTAGISASQNALFLIRTFQLIMRFLLLSPLKVCPAGRG